MGSISGQERQAYLISRDFKSDTITIPDHDMFQAMVQATRGDDVYVADDTTNSFQDRLCGMTGKEAALWAVSGTMTNQLALRSHLMQPPHSVLCDSRAHVHRYEAGGMAFHSQAMVLDIKPSNGCYLRWEQDVKPNLILPSEDPLAVHFCPTTVISLENTLSGTIFPQEEIVAISQGAHELGIRMHLDGARLWEVAAATGLSLEELCRPFDSVSLCLSKGIGAPIGSVLVGSKDLIKRARHFRKLFGGGIRQCGMLTGAANYCLDNVWPQFKRVHKEASRLAIGLNNIGIKITMPVQTNMLFIDPSFAGFSMDDMTAACQKRDITLRGGRIVLHWQITASAVDDMIQVAEKLATAKKMSKAEAAESSAHAGGQWHDFEDLATAQLASEASSMGKAHANGYH